MLLIEVIVLIESGSRDGECHETDGSHIVDEKGHERDKKSDDEYSSRDALSLNGV